MAMLGHRPNESAHCLHYTHEENVGIASGALGTQLNLDCSRMLVLRLFAVLQEPFVVPQELFAVLLV